LILRDCMTRSLSVHIGLACRLCAPGYALLTVMTGAALAQATDPVSPRPADTAPSVQTQPAVKQGAPPDGCQPIGLTASGEIVYPIQCKAFVERERAAEQKPAAAPAAAPEKAEAQPAAAEVKTVAKSKDSAVPATGKPAAEPVDAARLPKSAERGVGPSGCTHFRSYEATSATYLGFDGERRPCREAAGQSAKR
jgi:hypothetical protein